MDRSMVFRRIGAGPARVFLAACFYYLWWKWAGAQGDVGEPWNDDRQIETSVEAVLELGDVAGCMFEAEVMIGSSTGLTVATKGRLWQSKKLSG